MRRVMITGGLGFIGSNLVQYWAKKYPTDEVIVVDGMTYAARELTIGALPKAKLVYCDIRDESAVRKTVLTEQPDHILHLAAESHVCRSIDGPRAFMETNIMGTFNLLEAFRYLWSGHPQKNHRFLHVSTDEVYGSLKLLDGMHPDDPEREEKFHENRAYQPKSPYAASKASSDHIVLSYAHTYGMNVVVTNCSNNFGPNQHHEKLVPKAIRSILNGEPVTLYGSGRQVRDWLFVGDHCEALDKVFHDGAAGWSFCIGGDKEMSNVNMVRAVFSICCELGLVKSEVSNFRVSYTDDRPTDDLRYAVDCSLLKSLGWQPNTNLFEQNLKDTALWYHARLYDGVRG